MPSNYQLLTALLVVSTAVQAQAAPSIDLTFGVYTTDKPTVMYRKFMPLVEKVQERMEGTLKRDVAIEFRIFKTYEAASDALVSGDVDFVRFGPASYVLAKNLNPKIQLLAMETKKGKKTFAGYVVVRTNSPIRKLEDVRGRRFAFGDKNSTIGRYLVQKELHDAGVHVTDLSEHAYLGRHDLVFRAVELGDYDAGAVKSSTFRKLNRKKNLRVLMAFENVTKPWVARANLDPDTRIALAEALVGLRDKDALAALKVDGLVKAEDRAYDGIRESMTASRGFTVPHPAPPGAPGKD